MNNKKLLIIFFFCSIGGLQAGVNLQADSTQLRAGETLRLTLSVDGPQSNESPELAPLGKDFTLVGTERRMMYQIINGHTESLNQWILIVMPKHSGKLTIPSIRVGKELTTPLTIEVGNSSQPAAVNAPSDETVKIKTQVSEASPFVNQQVIYTVKLYNSRRLADANYQGPKVNNALLIPLGGDKQYQATENGINYLVEEQQYAIFPQKSGALHITPPSFSARSFDFQSEQINAHASAVTLHVKPAPNANSNWLPAQQIDLDETYDHKQLTLEQGSTLVRTVTLRAVGVAAQLMPTLQFATNDKFNVYPEPANQHTLYNDPNLIGTTTVKVTYLLNKTGAVVIPELTLPWFNVQTGKYSVARVPKRTLNVVAINQPMQSKNNTPKPIEIQPVSESSLQIFWWLVGGVLLGLSMAMGLFWYFLPTKTSRQTLRKNLRSACLANDAPASKKALLAWAKQKWPDIPLTGLHDLACVVENSEFKMRINQLEQALYKLGGQHNWSGGGLWRCVVANQSIKKNKKGKVDLLPPLNPKH